MWACALVNPKIIIVNIPANTSINIAILTPAPVFIPLEFIQVRIMIRTIAVNFMLGQQKDKIRRQYLC